MTYFFQLSKVLVLVSIFQITIMNASAVTRPTEYPADFQESDLDIKPWLKEFEYLVVINKATQGEDAQTLRVYRRGQAITVSDIQAYIQAYGSQDSKKRLLELAEKTKDSRTFLVSTGRDQFEPKGTHHSQKDSWTVTPTGYYYPQYFAAKHRSQSYSKKGCGGLFGKLAGAFLGKEMCTIMENAIFFNGPIAVHKAIPGTEYALGSKASGGCVRLSGPLAEYLFLNIKTSIDSRGVPLINPSGQLSVDSSGLPIMTQITNSIWGQMSARSALFIVQNKIVY